MINNENRMETAADMLEWSKKKLLAKMGCESFNPELFLVNLSKDENVQDLYLEVKYRILWFKLAYPDGRIETELLSTNDGLAILKASVYTDKGLLLASSHGSGFIDNGADMFKCIESAETKAVGRALNLAGFGTVYCGEELAAPLCEAPIKAVVSPPQQTQKKQQQQQVQQQSHQTPPTDSPIDINVYMNELRKTMTEPEALKITSTLQKSKGMTVKQLLDSNEINTITWVATQMSSPKKVETARFKVACEIIQKRIGEAAQNVKAS